MWGVYVPVAERRAAAQKKIAKLQKKGAKIEPISIDGKKIAREFWGVQWCEHLESFADYDNRLPRGRTYVRNGSVCHLAIDEGVCNAYVSGNHLYTVTVKIRTLSQTKWQSIKERCSGKIASMLELLQGKLSKHVMQVVANQKEGLFPDIKEIEFDCSCPDWAGMCKHVAAVLYGIGNRLDRQPELLFRLRGVNPGELVATELTLESTSSDQIDANDLGALFGIDIQVESEKLQSAVDMKGFTGPQLQKKRDTLGLTVQELAQRIGVTPASIYRWESTVGALKLQESSKKALQKVLTQVQRSY